MGKECHAVNAGKKSVTMQNRGDNSYHSINTHKQAIMGRKKSNAKSSKKFTRNLYIYILETIEYNWKQVLTIVLVHVEAVS